MTRSARNEKACGAILVVLSIAGAGAAACSSKPSTGSSASSSSSTFTGSGGSTSSSASTTSSGSTSATSSSSSSAASATSSSSGATPACPGTLTPSGPLVISGNAGVVLEGLKITSTTGDCVTIDKATDVTIKASEIGPCAGNAISVNASSHVTIVDNYLHPDHPTTSCCDVGDGIFAQGASSALLIQGNVITYGQSNIELGAGTSNVQVIGNFLLNPLGPFPRGTQVQGWNVSDVSALNNYALSSTKSSYTYPEGQEDAFNFGYTTGTIVASGNYITGGHSKSGCGMTADEAANGAQFKNNVLLDTGQCGIGVASGTNVVVDGNRVLNTTPVMGGGNVAIFTWSQYKDACGPTTITNNVACELKPDSSQSGFWNGGGCDPVTETGNVWDAAAQAQLSPPSQKLPPPPIPPQPYACVIASPYTTAP